MSDEAVDAYASTREQGAGTVPLLIMVGVSGSGKSTVGALLAERLGRPFLEDTDVVGRYAVRADGSSMTLSELVVSQDPRMEEWMTAAALDVLGREGIVTSLSPSQIRSARVRDRLEECREQGACVVHLEAQLSDIARREGMNVPRAVALGAPRALLARLSDEVRQAYAPYSEVTVATSGLSAAEVADQCEAACKMVCGSILSEE